MVGLHVNCIWIRTEKLGFATPSSASGKGVSCQQMDSGGLEGSYFSASPLFWFCCFIGCLLCRWASYHVPGTPTNLGHSFSKILPIHCGPSAVHWLDTRMAWNFAHLEWTSSTVCSRRENWELVANVLWFILETGISCCSTPYSPLDTKSFALATRGAKTTRTSKTVLGEQIGDVLSLPRLGSLGGGSTKLWSLEATFQYVFDFCCQWACNVCKV